MKKNACITVLSKDHQQQAKKLSEILSEYGLAFAGGAMLFVTVEEIIPETHSRGNVRESTIGLILGFIVMMFLENIFI